MKDYFFGRELYDSLRDEFMRGGSSAKASKVIALADIKGYETLFGCRVVQDSTLPRNVCELRDSDGKVLQRIEVDPDTIPPRRS